MTAKFELIEDDGFATATIGEETHEIDVWRVWGELDGLRAQVRANPEVDMLQLTVEYLAGLGFKKKISHKAANKFLKWHAELVNVEGKAGPGGSTPDSPGSTEPPPSASPPE